ncbi:MAG: 7-carboxy-7-deazaguanine synthase QueE [Desulfobacteraceae bacterium]|nr:7-carboxy-7-deazaguanine synthase QueE [Desulfobacteraceae bacterium]
MFTSIQGEGPFMGRPAAFVRLSGCVKPLCPWCDTKHAWGPGESMPVTWVADKVCGLGNDLVVITGGEPLLQWASGLNHLEDRLIKKGLTVQYETSGKVLIPAESKGFKVCSPKYLDGRWHYVQDNNQRADCFKFVVREDLAGVERFVKDQGLSPNRVWIMPLGDHGTDQLALSPGLWEFCVKNRFNFSPRLHTLFFNNQQGV